MFTGLIEEIGIVKKIAKGSQSYQFTIEAQKVLSDLKVGDSIATNGACLTAIDFSTQSFTVDIMHETVNRTTFNQLKVGDKVNLERAMQLSDRLGGHLVSGHIDGIGKITRQTKVDIATLIQVEASEEIIAHLLPKGSIAIDGISLTLTTVSEKSFEISVIPHTAQETTLLTKKNGDFVNLETDLIGKYVLSFLNTNKNQLTNQAKPTSKVSMDFLAQNGFL